MLVDIQKETIASKHFLKAEKKINILLTVLQKTLCEQEFEKISLDASLCCSHYTPVMP